MKLSDIRVDASLAEIGDWVDNIPDLGGVRLKVRGLNNKDYRKMSSKLFQNIPRAQKAGGQLDPEIADAITSRCLLNTVLMDWDGIVDDDDNKIPYSKDLAEKLLFDPEYASFRDSVVWAANVVGTKSNVDLEEDAKN